MRGGEGPSQFQSESNEVGEGRGARAFVVGHMRLGGGRKEHRSREEEESLGGRSQKENQAKGEEQR